MWTLAFNTIDKQFKEYFTSVYKWPSTHNSYLFPRTQSFYEVLTSKPIPSPAFPIQAYNNDPDRLSWPGRVRWAVLIHQLYLLRPEAPPGQGPGYGCGGYCSLHKAAFTWDQGKVPAGTAHTSHSQYLTLSGN